jgi:hypothetical protein
MEAKLIKPDCPHCTLLLKLVAQQREQIKRLEQRLDAVERERERQAASIRKKRETRR